MYKQIHGHRRGDATGKRPLDVRIIRRAVRILVSLAYGSCLAAVAVPPSLVVAAVPALGQSVGAAPDTSAIQLAFAAAAEPLGLQVLGEPQVERLDTNLSAVTTTAAVPLDQRMTPTFFLRRTLIIAERADLPKQIIAQTVLRIDYLGVHVTLEFVDRFMPAFDAYAGRTTGLAGKEIRRTAEFDSPGLEAYAAAHAEQQRSLLPNARDPVSPSTVATQIEAQNYVETATIVLPDGTSRTYPAGTLDLATVISGTGGAADLTLGCVTKCFGDAGGEISFWSAVCIVSSGAACLVGCALTAGTACIPCLGAVMTLCGVAFTTYGLVLCIARCINPNYDPPPSPTPTATPTPTPCVGDCKGDVVVSVDEILTLVNIALGNTSVGNCMAGDGDDDGDITVDEILTAVNNAVHGCPGT